MTQGESCTIIVGHDGRGVPLRTSHMYAHGTVQSTDIGPEAPGKMSIDADAIRTVAESIYYSKQAGG